jgi:alpha-L-arabinofuranosidase
LAVNARLSEDGKELVLDAINPDGKTESVSIALDGYLPNLSFATVEELRSHLNAVNFMDDPRAIRVLQRNREFQLKDGVIKYLLPPYSVTVIYFN